MSVNPEHFDPLDSQNVEPQGDRVEPRRDEDYKFPDEHREDFRGLNFIGALTDTFEFLGHEFVIRTLTTDEVLAVAQIVKEYEGTQGFMRAYATAMAASCIITIDGQGLVTPIGEDNRTTYSMAWQRFNYAKSRWYPQTIDVIYAHYLALENRADDVIKEMGKASG